MTNTGARDAEQTLDGDQSTADEASSADRLQADLLRLCGFLANYADRAETPGAVEKLVSRGGVAQRSLEQISVRLDGLSADAKGRQFLLTEAETEQMASARTLRDTMMDMMGGLQQSELANRHARPSY